jgi:hypothetical protein
MPSVTTGNKGVEHCKLQCAGHASTAVDQLKLSGKVGDIAAAKAVHQLTTAILALSSFLEARPSCEPSASGSRFPCVRQ